MEVTLIQTEKTYNVGTYTVTIISDENNEDIQYDVSDNNGIIIEDKNTINQLIGFIKKSK